MIPRAPQQTSALILALTHRWEPERALVIYTAFLDASGVHDGSPVMTLAGYVAHLGQWANLDREFGRLLKKNKLTYHHTKRMRARSGEYQGWKPTQYNRYVGDVQQIINRNTCCGFSISMKPSEYDAHYANERPKGIV